MKKNPTISVMIIGWACFLALFFASNIHAQKSDSLQDIRPQVIKKKIYPMPRVKGVISPTPPDTRVPVPKSAISRKSERRRTHTGAKPSIRDDRKMLANAKNSFQQNIPPYNATGTIDPFVPLIRETVIKKPKNPIFPVNDNPHKSPLEKIDLSQLKLTAIIIPDRGGNRGLVEESSGKGHIVVVNTPIGTRGGKVIEILKDRLIIEEKGRDHFGKTVTRKKELILPSLIAGK